MVMRHLPGRRPRAPKRPALLVKTVIGALFGAAISVACPASNATGSPL